MFLRRGLFLVKFLLCLPGIWGSEWGVVYIPKEACALAGSTLYVDCTYVYPSHLKVTGAFWYQGCSSGGEDEDLSQNKEFAGRVEYLGDTESSCSLRVTDLKESDSGEYCFRFITSRWWRGKWTGAPGVDLSVSVLQVLMASETVTEGESVTLTCHSTACTLSNSATYLWHKSSRIATSNRTTEKNTLTLDPVSSEDAGSYSCAVRGCEEHPSPAAPLTVRYTPKNTSVSVNPSEVSNGGLVTLTCSSDAYPPVHDYTWYRQNGLGTFRLGAGEKMNFTLDIGDSGRYICEAWNEVGSGNSTGVEITFAAPAWWITAELLIILSVMALLISPYSSSMLQDGGSQQSS
ncbi:B-cell receptor CD22-like [Sardina pilchardus]|uniref:B-cell receptor CD22-like n=1 Tax=Sardina pilchardus TaxID=27697 RepID=UPI002E10148D